MSNCLEQQIRARAHQIWVQSGCVEGCAEEHWRMAERELVQKGAEEQVGTALATLGSQVVQRMTSRKPPKSRAAGRSAKPTRAN